MSDWEEQFKADFLIEASQNLDDAESAFLALEKNSSSSETLDQIFRLAHNLKGVSRAVGFESIGEFTHELESFLLKVKSKQVELTPQVITVLLACNDHLRASINALKKDLAAKIENGAILARLKQAEAPVAAQPVKEISPEISAVQIQEQIQETPVETVSPSTPKAATSAQASRDPNETIRVNLGRLDRLNDYVGELVILQTVLRQQQSDVRSALVTDTIRQLGKLTREIQETAMSLRMVPVKSTFQKMQRVVRDTANLLGKGVNFVTEGEDTEIDRTVLEHLSDPLVHLLRNAVDHGLESAEQRLAAGKPADGSIRLRARHLGGMLMLEIQDDGGGIDPQKIRKKAASLGLLPKDSEVPDERVVDYIFAAGFSTKAEVSEISGRGVGLDVVRTNIERLSGEVKVSSEVGKGTKFEIRLPISLAIVDAFILSQGQQHYAIPISQVSETISPGQADIGTMAGSTQALNLRGQWIPLFCLAHLLRSQSQKDVRDAVAVILQDADTSVAVMTDDVVRQQPIVIKQLTGELSTKPGIIGTTILGNGKPALVLDLVSLVKKGTPQNLRRTG